MSVGARDHGEIGPSPSRTYYQHSTKIPGYGEQPANCMDHKPVGFCDQEAHVLLSRDKCKTRFCPEDWGLWVKDAVEAGVKQLAYYRAAQPNGPERRAMHVVASPDAENDRWTEERFYNHRSEAYTALDAVGVEGGVSVIHPYRGNDRGKQAFRDACRDPESDWCKEDGLWTYLRETSPEWGDLEEKTEPAPHTHTLATGSVEAEQIPDGWVIKNVRSLDPFYVDAEEVPAWKIHNSEGDREQIVEDGYSDMVGAMWYLLTHAAVTPNRQAKTYFGAVSPATFRPEEELDRETINQIDRHVEAALGRDTPEEDEGELTGAECPEEECEGEIVPIERGREGVEDEEWIATIHPEQRRKLRRAVTLIETADRPPPHIQADREAFQEWLGKPIDDRPMHEPLGASPPDPIQIGLDTATES
jgi:hypothetical protein